MTNTITVGSLVVDKAFVRLYGKLDATIFTVEDIDPMGLATLSYDEWGVHLTEPAWLDELEAI